MLCEERLSLSSESIDTCNSSRSSESESIEIQPSYDDIALIKVINKAKFPVFLGHSGSFGEHYAVKLFPFVNNQWNACFLNEIQFAHLQHKNVLSIVHYEADREAVFEEGPQKISYTIMELCPYGDFYDLVMSQKIKFNDILARTYFHQLIEGLEYLHNTGIAHLDLKLENLLLGADFSLKIGDFDQAYRKGQKTILSKGTVCYRAPELVTRTCQKPQAADIYSAAIILFLLKSGGVLPHSETQRYNSLDLFDLMINHNDVFWAKHREIQRRSASFFDEDFKALFNGMVKFNPKERITIQQIKASNWYNGPVYSQEELANLLKKYF